MIKAEWTNNDALSTGQTTHSNAHNTLNALDCVSRQYAIEHYQHVCRRTACKECPLHIQVTDTLTDCELELFLRNLPSAQPEYTEQDVRDSFNSGYACGMEAAQSEIIRCRDCRYGVDYYHDGNCYCAKPGYELLYFDGSWDFYCANAERRT